MKLRQRHILYFFLALLDVVLIFASYVIVSSAYVGMLNALGSLGSYSVPLLHNAGVLALVVYACAIVAVYALTKVYGAIYLGRVRFMAKRVLVINTVGILIFAAVLYALHLDDVSRLTLVFFYILSTSLVLFKEWLTLQAFYRKRKKGQDLSPVIVVGYGNIAQRYANVIGTSAARLEHVIGYVIPDGAFIDEERIAEECPLLRTCLGPVSNLDEIIARTDVAEIVIALETEDYACIKDVAYAADKSGIAISLVPFYSDIIPRQPQMDSVQGVKIINMRSMPLDFPLNAAIKRAADIVVSGLILVLFSWLLLITAIAVKISSPGPVLFRQPRTGRNGKQFQMLKFRSMRLPDGPVSTFTEDKDERKTRFGRFIRKFSIDELPQFFNVFVGDMSVVGPRPVVDEETLVYRKEIPLYMLRHQVRPGITGWAQVNGYRGGAVVAEAAKRTELDLWYIEHWSAWLDIKIFFMTLFGGFVNGEKL